jgi:hypothetical protein
MASIGDTKYRFNVFRNLYTGKEKTCHDQRTSLQFPSICLKVINYNHGHTQNALSMEYMSIGDFRNAGHASLAKNLDPRAFGFLSDFAIEESSLKISLFGKARTAPSYARE